jgi:hypothetical protein
MSAPTPGQRLDDDLHQPLRHFQGAPIQAEAPSREVHN